jgi:hemerythrin-like metal-binding protein
MAYFSSLIIAFMVLLALIAYGGRKIYENEIKKLDQEIRDGFVGDIKQVDNFFEINRMQLLFVKNILARINYDVDDLKPGGGKAEVQAILDNLVSSHPHYLGIAFFAAQGDQQAWVSAEKASPNLSAALFSRHLNRQGYLGKILQLEADGLFISPLDILRPADGSVLPIVQMAAPIPGHDGPEAGVVILTIEVGRLLRQLPEDIRLVNDIGLAISANHGGVIEYLESEHDFSAGHGRLNISDTENVLYDQVEYSPGDKLLVAKYFSTWFIKHSLLKLVAISTIIFGLFLGIVLLISNYNIEHFRALEKAQKAITYSLASLSEWRDPETGSHLERTRNFAVLVARTMKARGQYRAIITEQFLEDLYDAAPLHDIGKVGIRDEILLKPGKLTDAEFAVMKSHVTIGHDIHREIIERFNIESSFMRISRNVANHHHEKYGGGGYPDGLKGEAIPLEARIFTIGDVYDALRTKRPYKEAFSQDKTMAIILSERGKGFDPDVVDAFIECQDELFEIHESYKLFDDKFGHLLDLRSSQTLRVEWTDDLAVGVEIIDLQHKEFIKRVNGLFASIAKGKGKVDILAAFDFLHDYATEHFNAEEEVMDIAASPGRGSHKRKHQDFLENLLGMRDELWVGEITSATVVKLNAKVMDWLVNHIYKTDKALAAFLNTR